MDNFTAACFGAMVWGVVGFALGVWTEQRKAAERKAGGDE